MEIKDQYIYIFKGKKSSHSTPFKGKVVEMTSTSCVIRNLDTDVSSRYIIEDFKNNWQIIETVETKEESYKRLENALNTEGTKIIKENIKTKPFCFRGGGVCFCDGSCRSMYNYGGGYNTVS